ncbi:hypothetical protein Tco_1012762 [Tanacetum coccineum]
MARLWWLWWPQPARPPPQRWRHAGEHSEAPPRVAPPQPDTTWWWRDSGGKGEGSRGCRRLCDGGGGMVRMVMLMSAVMLHVGVEGGRWPENDAGDQMRGRTR